MTKEAPAWKPAEPVDVETAAAAEWAGSSAIAPPRTPTPPPTPAPVAPAPLPTPRAPARKATVARKPAGFGGPSERPPWLIPAIIGIVVILLLGTIGGIVLASRGSNPGVATKSPTPKTSPKASPKVSPTPSAGQGPFAVPNYGPAAEAPITKVIICSTATPCPIGAGIPAETGTTCDLNSCKIEVAIYFSAPQRSPVSYMVKFFDRCANTTKDLPGPNPYTPPGYVVVIPTNTNWPVAIPAGTKSAAIVVVTQQPSVATSPPWQLGPDSCA
jgi:hypothetical protein